MNPYIEFKVMRIATTSGEDDAPINMERVLDDLFYDGWELISIQPCTTMMTEQTPDFASNPVQVTMISEWLVHLGKRDLSGPPDRDSSSGTHSHGAQLDGVSDSMQLQRSPTGAKGLVFHEEGSGSMGSPPSSDGKWDPGHKFDGLPGQQTSRLPDEDWVYGNGICVYALCSCMYLALTRRTATNHTHFYHGQPGHEFRHSPVWESCKETECARCQCRFTSKQARATHLC